MGFRSAGLEASGRRRRQGRLQAGLDPSRTDIYGKPETLGQVRVYHNTAGPQFALDAPHLLATLGATANTYTHENAFWDAARHYYLVVTVDVDGYRSGGGHELPRGIGDLRLARTGPSVLGLTWSAVVEDLLGRSNPAAATSSMLPEASHACRYSRHVAVGDDDRDVRRGEPAGDDHVLLGDRRGRPGSETPW